MRRIRSTEHDEQVAVCQWWAAACASYGLPERALLAIPNAARRSYALASYMKAEGLRAGTPDMLLAVPHRNLGGLWIEMKRKPNKPSDEQIEMIDFLECGYAVKVAYSADEAIDTIKEYLDNRP